MAQIGNGEGLDAALGAAASQIVSGQIKDVAQTIAKGASDNPAIQELLANLISSAASSGIGMAAGGESGAASAANMDRYNRQLHPAEIDWIKENVGDFAEREGITEEEALKRLTKQALVQIDEAWGGILKGD